MSYTNVSHTYMCVKKMQDCRSQWFPICDTWPPFEIFARRRAAFTKISFLKLFLWMFYSFKMVIIIRCFNIFVRREFKKIASQDHNSYLSKAFKLNTPQRQIICITILESIDKYWKLKKKSKNIQTYAMVLFEVVDLNKNFVFYTIYRVDGYL